MCHFSVMKRTITLFVKTTSSGGFLEQASYLVSRELKLFIGLSFLVSGFLMPRSSLAGGSVDPRILETQDAIELLQDFPSQQSLLSPGPSCGSSVDFEDESSIDYSEESCSITPTQQSPMEIASRVATKLKSLPGPVGGYLSKLIEDYEQVLQPKNYGHQRVGDGNFGLASYLVKRFKSDPDLMRSALG
ncbi:hypothetical protein EBZ37_13790, partial [bacterium]|nr:hypothetical protein [bacterium]